MNTTRICPQCGITKPLLSFYHNGRRYLAACADCKAKEDLCAETRNCKGCGTQLPLADFSKRGSGRRSWLCSNCRKKAQAQYRYEEDPDETHRTCHQCGRNQPISNFVRERKSMRGRAVTCKDCRRDRAPLKRTAPVFTVFGFDFSDSVVSHRRTRYRLTATEQHDLILKTAGKCTICGKDFQSSQDIHFDHSHKTGEVRAVICQMCNLLLGACGDEIEVLTRAIQYLEDHA